MNKRLLKVAAYLGSQGFFAEAAQLKKVAGSRGKMSDFNPYAEPNFYGKVTPLDEEGLSDKYFIEVPKGLTDDEDEEIKSEIKNVCRSEFIRPIEEERSVKVYGPDVMEGNEEVSGFEVEIRGVSESVDTLTPLEKLVTDLARTYGDGFTLHNLN